MKKIIIGVILFVLVVVAGWFLWNKQTTTVNESLIEIEIETEEKITNSLTIPQETNTITNHLMCGKRLDLIEGWEIDSEIDQEVIIKTNYKDTEGYDVYVRGKAWYGKDPSNLSAFNENKENKDSLVARIDCAGICYQVKEKENKICNFNRSIYSDQTQPEDFPNNDGAWYPTINDYDTIANQIGDML